MAVTIVATLPVLFLLHFGTFWILCAYLSGMLSIYLCAGFVWLWKSAPDDVKSAQAARTIVRMFWSVSGLMACIALWVWFARSSLLGFVAAGIFVFPALSGSIVYERTLRRIGGLHFWKKGL